MDIDFEKEIKNIRAIDKAQNYWLIRTYRGSLFETFIDEQFVGIGYNTVPYGYIRGARNKNNNTLNELKNYLENNYHLSKSEVTKWANQLVSFEFDVKIGDIVIIPNEGSSSLCIGAVKSDTKIVKSDRTFKLHDGKYEYVPEKRKQIEWLKPFNKTELFGDINGLFSSHLALTSANKFSELIESNLSSVFIKDENIFISIRINQDQDINAFAMRDFLDCLTYFYKELCDELGIEAHEDGLYIKIKVQSKGGAVLKTAAISAGVGIALIIALCISDPEISVDIPDIANFKMSGKGSPLENISKFMDANQERRHRETLFKDSMDRLKAIPSTIDSMIDSSHQIENNITNKTKK